MSKFVENRATAEAYLVRYQGSERGDDEDRNIAAAQVWALLALAEAVRDVADAVRGKDRED